nr:response regulator [uncultured Acetatifactor sp.]
MYTLLLVDDEEFALAALRHALPWEAYGFRDIHTAASSPDAWEILTKQRIDACFIDIRMPGMTGLELLAEAQRQNLETLFVVVSGYSDFSYARQAIQFGVLDYCLKPVSEEECRPVLEKLARHIPLNRISHDPAYVSRLLAEEAFCGDFLSALTASGSGKLALLLVRGPEPGQILAAADPLLPARVFFLGEDEAFLIWGGCPGGRRCRLLPRGMGAIHPFHIWDYLPGACVLPECIPAHARHLPFPEHCSHRHRKAPLRQ